MKEREISGGDFGEVISADIIRAVFCQMSRSE